MFLEQERLLLGEGAFRREYLAEFSPGGGGAFLEEDAVAAVIGRYHELRPEQGTGWLIGLDVAFSSDPSAAVVVGRDPENRKRLRGRPCRALASEAISQTATEGEDGARAPGRGRDRSRRRRQTVARPSATAPVVTDQHARLLVESGLKERGVPRVIHRTWSPSSQTEAFRLLRARIYGDTISLPIHDQLQRELCRVRERARAGQSAIELPRSVDGHCDLASALALAVWELESRPVWQGEDMEQFQEWSAAAPVRQGAPGHRRSATRAWRRDSERPAFLTPKWGLHGDALEARQAV